MVMLGTRLSVAGLLSFGTLTSLLSKVVYELQGEGLDGELRYFRKPWFMTMLMFMGMSLCLPLSYLESKPQSSEDGGQSSEPLLQGNGNDSQIVGTRSELQEALMLSIPTLFDLVATVLMNIGLLSVTASVYQMMRGAEMVFAAILAVVFLHRSLNKLHYSGIGACITGICLVGLSSVLAGDGGTAVQTTPAQVALGMGLIVLSQAVQAAQVTFEDYFMSEMDIDAMKIVGIEGLVGASLMLFVVSPIVQTLPGEEGQGIHENLLDTLHMIRSNGQLAAVLAVQMFGLLSYNYMGMHVTGNLGAVFRTVLETMRTLFVWLLGLALFYTGTGLGEKWNEFSLIQAAGFVVLVVGTVVYGRGDERAALLEVERIRATETDVETATVAATGKASAPASIPVGTPTSRPVHIMPSPSFRASQSITSASYQEALVSSLRSHGMGSFHG